MHCILLAAGFSTRMYPLTKNFPKALLPVKGKALVDYVYDDIRAQKDITATTVISNANSYSLFRRHFQTQYPSDDITVLDNGITDSDKRHGAIGDLVYAVKSRGITDDLLVVASDTLTSLKMQDFIRFYKQYKGVTTACFDGKDKERIRNKLGCIVTEKNRIVRFVEKPPEPPSTLMAIPFYIFPAKSVPLLGTFLADNSGDAPGSFITWVLQKYPTYAYNIGTGYYYDLGTCEEYAKVKAKI